MSTSYHIAIIKNFKSDKYWVLWLTLVEVIMNSGEVWKYAHVKPVKSFFEKVITRPSWNEVIKFVKASKDAHLKKQLKVNRFQLSTSA